MGKIRILAGLALVAWLGCSSFDDNYEPIWDDDDDSAGDDDDHVGDDDDQVGDDDDHVGDDDDATGTPIIRVDPESIPMQVEVLDELPATADLTIFNDGDAPLTILSVSQTLYTNGIDISSYGGEIGPSAHYTISPAVTVECHAEGLLNETIEIASNDMLNNPLEVPVIVDCVPAG